jgi:hypothetical protein
MVFEMRDVGCGVLEVGGWRLEVGGWMLDVKLSKGYNKHEKQYCFFNSRRGFAAPGIEKFRQPKAAETFHYL